MSAGATLPDRAYIVVLNWNGSNETENCVRSLLKLNHTNFCVVVCDNQSDISDLTNTRSWGATLPSGLCELTTEQNLTVFADQTPHHRQVILLHTGGNLGFAGGVNAGLRYAVAQEDMAYAWILNNDTIVDSAALQMLVDRMRKGPGVGICGSTLIYERQRDVVQAWGGASYRSWRARSVALGAFTNVADIPADSTEVEKLLAYVNGASMLVTKEFLETVGLMDESYFLYSEEHDWAQRGRSLGYRLAYAPKSIVYHKHGATIGTSASGGSSLSLHYLYRNKALFSLRHHPATLPITLLALVWDGIKFLAKGQASKFMAVLDGLWAFVCGRTGLTYSPSRQRPKSQ